MRKITMKWTQRNIVRLIQKFDINCRFDGTFTSKLGWGYKMGSDNKNITFVFSNYNAAGGTK